MAIVQNWRRIRTHSVQRHASQNADEPRIVAFHRHHSLPMIDVNAHDAIKVQNIRLHRQDIQEGNDARPEGHSPMHGEGALDIRLAQNSFVVVEIIPKQKIQKEQKEKIRKFKTLII